MLPLSKSKWPPYLMELWISLWQRQEKTHFQLKPEQKQIVEAFVRFKKDVMGILPTGFGKSLVFHVLSDVFDFMDGGQTPEKGKSITVVISPLTALMRDQISKLSHLSAIILDGMKKGIDLATLQAREGNFLIQRFFWKTTQNLCSIPLQFRKTYALL